MSPTLLRRVRPWLLLLIATPLLLGAMTMSIESMDVDGLQVRDLSCELESGGFLALPLVVGAIAGQKAKLDACNPSGGAVRMRWTWAEGAATKVDVTASSKTDKDTCITGVIQAIEGPVIGSCSTILLVGEPTAAGKAADVLVAKEAEASEAAPPPATTP